MRDFDSDAGPSIVSITDRVRLLPIGMPVTSVYFLGDNAVFIGAEENAAIVNAKDEISRVAIHGGAVLCAASDGERIVTGGDDGKVVALNAKGETSVLATDAKRRWIDCVALHPDGAFAWSAGKTAFVRSGKAEDPELDAALKAHVSQVGTGDWVDTLLRDWAVRDGKRAGVQYGEAYRRLVLRSGT